jgi:Uma2 family endonuclease
MAVDKALVRPKFAEDEIDWDSIITEDDTPVDNYVTERDYTLLTVPLDDNFVHSIHGKRFIVASDVGIFTEPKEPPIVPDVFLSLGLQVSSDQSHKRSRSYFMWITGKPPEVVIEIVSNEEGGEDTTKLARYAHMGVKYYAIHDPHRDLSDVALRFFVLRDGRYVETTNTWMPEVELGLTLWVGEYRGMEREWLRWCDRHGQVIPTAAELFAQERVRSERALEQVETERLRAEEERLRAEEASRRAEEEWLRAERLAERLRQLGLSDVD